MKTSKINDKRYLLPDNMTKKHFLETLKSEFIVKQIENINEQFSILESFEWGLYKKQLLAVRHEDQSISLWNNDNLFDSEVALKIDNINAASRFWWDFPDCEAKQLVKPILKLRSLNPIFKGVLKTEQLNLQNDEGKILVFCQLISIYKSEQPRTPLMRQLRINSVIGYAKENGQAIELIKSLGGFEASLPPIDSLLGAIGISPQPYTVKPQLDLPPQMPARTAVSSIIATMIEKQRLTEPGVIKDIDTEFLHHYRVAIRMVRAAIAQLKDVFPQNDVPILKQRFGDLARETNKLRDLDVFILDQDRYMNLLPETMRNDLTPMFVDFQKNRHTEAKRISRWIGSKTYRDEINELQALFENGYSAMETQWSEKATIELAINKIQKSYKNIYKAAIKITHTTPDGDIHRIRIYCKKLRYLLYFFGSQFNKKKIKIVGNHLKSLQDTLGIFNDLTVQGEFLKKYLYQLEHKPKKDIMLIASLGGLISSLYSMQIQERDRCINELAVFSNADNRQLFKETFIDSSLVLSLDADQKVKKEGKAK
ncbi:MAG: CHAD domain-containing protein [gamma proteobacterium symbiont of Bathyaustriella thionipta]|nr:CHAD domain-containing protein [gamma proteobacterium symbiont of Bathyaustriella thionipta]MCU7951249.1 CHAD domain-containing protein [gamma proteobacterium symbiont of Bathyaustriella thionipta]MCU7953341.1 CHAD domain-containing protein [gamma proteobacterium symbiont of Bathyaustriella thionipta]MCU7957777.1 CHAD domain-containing protein [gamma proteobacterium symbiont of Bathyaustriella thionipta]MCU7967671.1 CHAD domain-containing protein [gamma proteobacterium symbiont of Bathyaustr